MKRQLRVSTHKINLKKKLAPDTFKFVMDKFCPVYFVIQLKTQPVYHSNTVLERSRTLALNTSNNRTHQSIKEKHNYMHTCT